MHPAREASFVDMQCQALRHLAERCPHITLPRVIPAKNGELFSSVVASDGSARLAWLLTFVPGIMLAKVRPHSPELLRSIGKLLGEMDAALESFSHPTARRDLKWDLSKAGWIEGHLSAIADGAKRNLVEKVLAMYQSEALPALSDLRRSVIYGDANDHNILVNEVWAQPRKAISVIDFGDMHLGVSVSEVAIAAAYALLGEKDPLPAAAQVLAGYHEKFPCTEKEIATLFPLICARLAVSVVNSARRSGIKPADDYVRVSESAAWQALEQLAEIHPRFAHYTFRAACGLPAVPQGADVQRWLRAHSGHAAPILEFDIRTAPVKVFDLSVGSIFLGADPRASQSVALTQKLFSGMHDSGVDVGIGRYNEPRLLYTSALFGELGRPTEEKRTIHLGLDLFVKAGAKIYAPLDGVVHTVANNTAALDYGPVVILRHTAAGQEFFTLYGHLATQTLQELKVGQEIVRGQVFSLVGDISENGGWPSHLHFQIILDLLDRAADFPGVAAASQQSVWSSISPDPNLLLGIPADTFPLESPAAEETLAARRSLLGKNLSLSYRHPVKIVRGWMQYLYDETGRAYLDVYNNVPLVGHSHPRVVAAVQSQIGMLNTNTRYLHDHINRYAERLTRLLPPPLRVCFFLNSGSEANELALRLARAHTRREDVIVLEHAYHGHTSALIDISPYKFNGPGGAGQKPWVHIAPMPDDYRGAYRREDPHAGEKYARHVEEIIAALLEKNTGVAAFIAETFPSVGGQIVLSPGYLAAAYRAVRKAGGVCIADEVQVGFGRLGTHFWGFETQQVVPDIVVLGKPIGNGFPLAAVITTAEIASSFDNGMEFFSTFGGNPVGCAAGLAVLEVLEEQHLQRNALQTGNFLLARLKELQTCHALAGDVRGSGLFLGIDLVRDRTSREPATQQAGYIVNRLRECGVLAGTDGPHHNVIKLRPPLIFSEADATLFVETLDSVLQEDAAQP